MEMTFELVTITPEMAREMLEHNTHNRKPNMKRVDELAKLHGTKHWKQAADPIKFSADGTLLDGQHRLLAIIRSGIPQQYIVVRNVEDDAQLVMDTGQSRTFGQHLTINGVKNASNVSSIMLLILNWEAGKRNFQTMSRVSIPEMWDLYQARDEHWQECTRAAWRYYNQSKVLPLQVYGTLWHLFSAVDESDAESFFDRLTSEFGHEPDNPISLLKSALVKDKEQSVGKRKSVRGITWQVGISIKAWNLWRSGAQGLKQLKFTQGGNHPEKMQEPI